MGNTGVIESGYGYWEHIAEAASREAFSRNEVDPLLSVETIAENGNVIDFKSFAQSYPEKFFQILSGLRPDLQELFIEYYLVGKSQTFLARCRHQIQARAFEALHVIEEAFGAILVLGARPTTNKLRPILLRAGLEKTEYGSLAFMIMMYAKCRDYSKIAKACGAPLPAIRKIFRPATARLLESKNLEEVAVGAYLRSLTYKSSLTKAGFGKRHEARMRKVRNLHFDAPALEHSPLLDFGRIDTLGNTPWYMFESSAEKKMDSFFPVLEQQAKRIFGKHPGQIFAPVNKNGELVFGYIFARSVSPTVTRGLLRIRGISDISATYTDADTLKNVIAVPHADVEKLIDDYVGQKNRRPVVGDFVRILNGDAKDYCGTITARNLATVEFPSGRAFTVRLAPGSAKVLRIPKGRRTFWGDSGSVA